MTTQYGSINDQNGDEEPIDNGKAQALPQNVVREPFSLTPYMQLMRLDRPAGFIGFYMPSVLGLVYAASIAEPSAVSPVQLLQMCIFFFVANLLIRGAACTWNDNIDQEYDRKVDRCRNRPIARGAVSTTQGHIFMLAQTAALVWLFNYLPRQCDVYSIAMGALYVLYPFCKRFTHYPQAILGVPLALAIIVSAYSFGVLESLWNSPDTAKATIALCVIEIFWTMIYDTIYAHQDLQDDIKAGVKSMAVRFQNSTKKLCTILAILQVVLLVLVGIWTNMTTGYFLVGCGGSAVSLAVMIYTVDLNVPASCAKWFKLGFVFVGGSMNAGFFVAYLEKLLAHQ
ncbi:Para-hydroxybenzoate--polyprenyltransferase mitochondrial precursor (PHB:polyprenyltransferase) [Penicillium malachiteum]|uniref:Para-hydroxybenzoate--polyprenyltransferase mitochondrial precursor (PHB:polyprenyltransferase) n=1 Tax=Penicillium malachiteum TaxID=1324776 RepID=UPI002547CEB3|nr:Para-hydroxybenzoate--polyprenyltransferase mitochondrial precursor (PHB:polyprenyltransferase) [Penicillium malachiteum]KAJ5725491.1 Para-hydroxybenzoate--polyprenyltransferase mitochondrial precursor (PHB:polyprenyltransferase) [Penicillium malachiteum]